MASPTDVAKRCRITLAEAQIILNVVCKEYAQEPRALSAIDLQENDEIFTTGSALLDNKLGGGIRTGMIWEIVGQR